MSEDRSELAGDLQALLESERQATGPSAERLAAIAAGIGPLAGGTGGADVASRAVTRGAGHVGTSAKALAVHFAVFLAGGAAGAGLHAALTPPPSAAVVSTTPTSPASSDEAKVPAPLDGGIDDAGKVATPADLPAAPRTPVTSSARPTSTTVPDAATTFDLTVEALDAAAPVTSALADERAIVERARNAIARREGIAALQALHEHEARFPQPALGEESDELKVEALVLLGRGEDARRAAQAFLTRYPTSILRGRIERALEELP